MAMHADEIAKFAHVNLKNFRAAAAERDRLLVQLVQETVHGQRNGRRDTIKVISSGVEEPRSVTLAISRDLSSLLEKTDCLAM